MSLQPLGQYRLEEHLSSSRVAETYRAYDVVRKRVVFLHTIKASALSDETGMRRLRQQAQTAAELVHPRLAWVWEIGEDRGQYYVVERYVSGPTLAQRLAESGHLSWEEAIEATTQLAQGLDFAHSRGWVHRAVTPESIFLSSELGAVLSGLALSGLTEQSLAEQGSESERLQRAKYLAPEIWQGQPSSPASDQYALACILVEMLTDKPLFDGASVEEIRTRHLSALKLPHTWPSGTPWQIELALERALAQQPALRYASVSDFAAAPQQLAALTGGDEQERRRRAEMALQRRAAEEEARRAAEEAARLAALEQAKRELEEQVRQQVESLTQASQAPLTAETLTEAPSATRRATKSAETERRAKRATRGMFWLFAALFFTALAWAMFNGLIPITGLIAKTPTPTFTQASVAVTSVFASFTASPTRSPTHTPTVSPTLSSTPTASPSRTSTLTPSHSPSPTVTPKPATLTPTSRPPREDTDD